MQGMQEPLDFEEEAKAADLLAVHLEKVEAPQVLIEQAKKQAAELRERAEAKVKAKG